MGNLFKSAPKFNEKALLSTIALFFVLLGCIPIMMMSWVYISSSFTRMPGSDGSGFFAFYFILRIVLALSIIFSFTFYDRTKRTYSLIPASVIATITSFFSIVIYYIDFVDKKALDEKIGILKSDYSKDYIYIGANALIFLFCVVCLLYLCGIIRTNLPALVCGVTSSIFMVYVAIMPYMGNSYSRFSSSNLFDLICDLYSVAFIIGALLLILSTSPVKREGKEKTSYKAKRMRK